ncbi:MAG: dipeptide epimerase, partial [Chloroflexota bacterium]
MSVHLTQETLHLALRDPFRIARSDHGTDDLRITTVVVELRDDRWPGLVGLGEGYPDRFYGETPATIEAVLPLLSSAVDALGEPEPTADWLQRAGDAMAGAIRWNGGAKCALDIALHDLAGKATGLPVHRLLGL